MKGVVFVVLTWLIVVVAPGSPMARGRAIVNAVRNQAHQIDGKAFTQEALQQAIAEMKLDYSLNRYIPEVNYAAPSEWKVRLVPEKRKTFMNLHSWPYRFFFLEFGKMEYPEILIGGNKTGHNQVPEDTDRKLAEPQH